MLTEEYKKEMKSVNKKEIFAEAVALAIDEAIRDNVLKDILSKKYGGGDRYVANRI